MSNTAFSSLPLSAACLDNLKQLGYDSMTEVQAQSLPLVLAGKDLKAQAKTGSGKTAAFGIGLLHKLDPAQWYTQMMVLCPTRELADQVSKELRRLARFQPNVKITTLCGGTPIGPQFGSLEHPPHIVVGTPGRMLKHCRKGTLDAGRVNTLVLDEADRMLDMGFQDDMLAIIEHTPEQRQTLLFSATYPREIEAISAKVQRQPQTVQVESVHSNTVIKQFFYEVTGDKTEALAALLQDQQPASAVVFCARKQQCQELADTLKQQGFRAQALHGDLEQKDRDRVLVQFANGSVPLLIATDVAARGLDVKELGAVINVDLPADPDVYIHRIGRTGRAGHEGLALSLFHARESKKVNAIEEALGHRLKFVDLPQVSKTQALEAASTRPAMVTLCLNAGRKQKLRPGDILGALTANKALPADDIGKIDIFDMVAYVAVKPGAVNTALKLFRDGNVKGKKVLARKC